MWKNQTAYDTVRLGLIGNILAAQETRSGIEIFRSSISVRRLLPRNNSN